MPACDSDGVKIHPCPTIRFILQICVGQENMREGCDIEHVQAEGFSSARVSTLPLALFSVHENSWSF